MKSIIRWSPVVMFLGLGGWFVLPVRDAPEAPRSEKDQFDDPLPPGAIARYGTVRLRDGHGISGLQFLPDGKELLSWSPAGTRVWEATTGKAIRSFAPRRRAGDVEHGRATALSPDARTFVVIYEDPRYSDSDSRLSPGHAEFWDVSTGEMTRRFAIPQANAAPVISPDGKTLALVGHGAVGEANRYAVRLYDIDSGREIRVAYDLNQEVKQFLFMPDVSTGRFVPQRTFRGDDRRAQARRAIRQGSQLEGTD